jgi:dephospho-CoA kinase
MKIIGLTGGIGSGKSSVARVFESLGVPIFYADKSGRTVLEADALVRNAVINLIGKEAYDEQNQPNREFIASIVFSDDQKLAALNQIIHPAVARDFESWKARLTGQPDYCLREAAILFESGSDKDCDHVICVSADRKTRIDRVKKRDGASIAAIEARMAKQMPQEDKEERSDFVITNNGNESVIEQIVKVHLRILG